MSSLTLLKVAICCGLLLGAVSSPLLAFSRSLTVDDFLRMEAIGRVVIAEDGAVLYEQMPSLESAPNIGSLSAGTDFSALAKIFKVGKTLEQPRPLFEQAPNAGYWLGGLSPDRSKVAVYSLESGRIKAGVFDFRSNSLVWFSFTPNYTSEVKHPIWISNDELVYATLPEGKQPQILNGLGIAAQLDSLWGKTFEGKEPSATVLHSTTQGAPLIQRLGRLVRVNARSGDWKILDQGYVFAFRLSPDGHHLAAVKTAGSFQLDPIARLGSELRGGLTEANQLVLYDVSKEGRVSQRSPCKACFVDPTTIQWSADGRHLTFFSRPVGTDSTTQHTLTHYDIESGRLVLMPGPWSIRQCFSSTPSAFPLGRGNQVIAFAPIGMPPKGCDRKNLRFDAYLVGSEKDGVNLTALNSQGTNVAVGITEAGIYVLSGNTVWQLGKNGRHRIADFDEPVQPWMRNQTEEAFFAGTSPPHDQAVLVGKTRVFMLDLVTHSVQTIRKPATGNVVLKDVANRVEPFAIFQMQADGVKLLIDSRSSELDQPLVKINQHLSDISLPKSVPIEFKFLGETVRGCLLLPIDYRAGQKYPTVVEVYPGQEEEDLCYFTSIPTFVAQNLQLLVSHGYAVLTFNSPNRLIRAPGKPLARMTALTTAAVDEAVRMGLTDGDRLGLYGFSQGHHTALKVLTETHRFKAAWVSHGISDFASHYGSAALKNLVFADNTYVGNALRYEWPESPNYLGTKPWEDPQSYIENSPVFAADKVDTPILFTHSDLDIFPLQQSLEMFNALHRLRKPAEYVIYWGEGHQPHSPANIRDMWKRVFAWFDAHLLGVGTDSQRLH